ncbi:MAG: MFS transporter [archaeon]|nr:MFS transporter [Nanoarchaeota archaeon]
MKKEKNVLLLGLVSFINDTSSKIIEPLLPLFIASLGGGGIAIGLISGLSESVAAIFKMLSGYWGDKLQKRKGFVFGGYLTSALAKFGLAFSTVWGLVLALKSVERLGKGLRSAPRDAILASSVDKEKRGKYFGIHRAFDSGGSVLGSLLALLLFWYLGMSFKMLFIIAGILGIFSVLPVLFVKEKKVVPEQKFSFKVGWKEMNKELKWFFIISAMFALANFSYMFFVLRVQDFFTGSLLVGGPLLFYIIYQVSYTVMAVPAGFLSDRIGRRKVLMLGYGSFILVCLGFIFFDKFWHFIIMFLLYGLMYALVNSTERAYVSDLAPRNIRGTALGTYYLFTSLAVLPGGLIAGLLWDLSKIYTFSYGIALGVIVLFLFWVAVRENEH